MMTLAGAKIVQTNPKKRDLGLATAVEFIHSATLLHDDVIDESNLRRGRDTANLVWEMKHQFWLEISCLPERLN